MKIMSGDSLENDKMDNFINNNFSNKFDFFLKKGKNVDIYLFYEYAVLLYIQHYGT